MWEFAARIMESLMLRSRRLFGTILAVCLAVSLAAVGYPLYVIRPFRAQGARELAAALTVSRYCGLATALSAIVALAALALYWRGQTARWRRIAAATCAGLVCALAVLARVNVFELIFHPIAHASFTAAAQSKLDSRDKVIAVVVNGEARAYPIRAMGYHHIVNDEVGKVAIVATY